MRRGSSTAETVGDRRRQSVVVAGSGQPLPGLSAIVPVHDEAGSLEMVAHELLAVLPAVAAAWELIVVDDGSRDATAAIADRLASSRVGVRVVRHATNRGYGAALASGLAAARHPFVFWMDGDGQFRATELRLLVAALGEAEAVIGYRARRADRWIRRLNTALWNSLVRLLFDVPARDVNCAFKLVRRDVLGEEALQARGAMISTEILVRLHRRGSRIVEVPVAHFPRQGGSASGAAPRVVARALVELLRLAPRLWRGRLSAARRSPSSR